VPSPRFEDTEVLLKWVMRDGVLQEGPGPSIAVEFTLLPPLLSFDVGIRHGLSNAAPNWGGTAGLTFVFPWDLAEEKRP
jgi:hypothetical protein